MQGVPFKIKGMKETIKEIKEMKETKETNKEIKEKKKEPKKDTKEKIKEIIKKDSNLFKDFKSSFDQQSDVIESELKIASSIKNYSTEVRLLLNAIEETESKFGATVPIDYLLKRPNKKLDSIKKGPTYGLVIDLEDLNKSVKYWVTIHKFMRTKNLLKEEKISKFLTIYKLTDEAIVFKNDKNAVLPDWSINF